MSSNSFEDDMAFTFKIKDIILFSWMFLLFIFSWISVAVVGRAVDNITFTTLGLSDKSTLHTVVIAMVIVFIEILTLYYFNNLGMNLYGDNFITSENSNKDEKSNIKDSNTDDNVKNRYHQNDVHFLDRMNGISMIAKIEGITII